MTTPTAALIRELRSRRHSLGWSLSEVAQRCGLEEQLLAEWERGMGSPRLDAALAWAAALGLKLELAEGGAERRSGVEVDWSERRITIDGNPVRLTPMEWKVLERLAANPGEVVPHADLFRHLYGEDRSERAQSTAIRVLITKLRRMLPVRIEARWGQGYVIEGIPPSRPEASAASPVAQPETRNETAPVHFRRERLSCEPPVRSAPMRRAFPGFGNGSAMERLASAPQHLGTRRAEELGVIERFLAERGATRCPDVATIERSPLPTLVWDKVKRKWVRPAAPGREAN